MADIPDNVLGIVAIALGVGGPMIGWMVTSIAISWRKVRTSEHLAALKQTMIERGMSAEDIERVINAGLPGEDKASKYSVIAGPRRRCWHGQ
jgi:hypothetical protein